MKVKFGQNPCQTLHSNRCLRCWRCSTNKLSDLAATFRSGTFRESSWSSPPLLGRAAPRRSRVQGARRILHGYSRRRLRVTATAEVRLAMSATSCPG
ncbi:hypothetical protein KUF71_017739 [Frankliniella fusca]|uniref:Uncharacterized protein n=1 Tax=Frankliniella fusca TaxID=407009 RepID=A0AAE1HXB1_9NEOP|nr:hypothetical protein KUF71_017739 [Frankliniella fusca]